MKIDRNKTAFLILTLVFSLSSVLTLYSNNFFEVSFSQVSSSFAFSLIYAIVVYLFLVLIIPEITSRIWCFVFFLFISLHFIGPQLLFKLLRVTLANYVPDLSLFFSIFFGLLLLVIVRFQKFDRITYEAVVYVLLLPLFSISIINMIVNFLVHSGSIYFNFQFFNYIVLLSIATCVFFRRFTISTEKTLSFLIIANIIFTFLPSITIVSLYLSKDQSVKTRSVTVNMTEPQKTSSYYLRHLKDKPDIYWFVLDGYGRADILKKYDFDNSKFLNWLGNKDFWVGEKSNCNYMRTNLTLVSTMNMSLVGEKIFLKDSWQQRVILNKMMNDSFVVRFLRDNGYDTFAFPMGLGYIDMKAADKFYSERSSWLSSFEEQFYNVTIFPSFEMLLWDRSVFSRHRNRFFNVWNNIPVDRNAEKPCFVMAHLVSPHPPFVFNELGGEIEPTHPYSMFDANDFRDAFNISPKEYMDGYLKQVIYINTVLKKEIKQLLALNPQPVIIIQADHGHGANTNFRDINKTNLFERFGILNAIFIPSEFKKPNIGSATSSINTFPIVFNSIFNTQFKLQPDRSFYTAEHKKLKFPVEVTAEILSNH